jgi:hypothetical protein
MFLSKPKRMMSPRAAARRMAQVSVEMRDEERGEIEEGRRVGWVDIRKSPLEERARLTRINVWLQMLWSFKETR